MPPKKASAAKIKEIKAAKAGVWMPKEPELSNEGGFLRLRHGLKEHIRKGYITSNDFAAYYTLHCFADWTTGICDTTAASLAAMWGDWECKDKKRSFRTALERLRERGYIDYPLGGGEHGIYPVLINKAEPTKGRLKGWRLRLREGKPGSSDFSNPWYEYVSPTSFYDAYGEQADKFKAFAEERVAAELAVITNEDIADEETEVEETEGGARRVERAVIRTDIWRVVGGGSRTASRRVGGTVVCRIAAPLQDVINMTTNVENYKNSFKTSSNNSQASALLDESGEQLEFLDESKLTTSFNLEDEDDELSPAEAEAAFLQDDGDEV